MASKYRMCVSLRLAIGLNYVFKNFFFKFTYKYNIEIAELMCMEVRSGGS
jgi:hypothetical protein